MNKLLAVVGPTASGKSDLAVTLASFCNGEVISADSRQVYKDLDITTGKITKEEMRGIPHHLLDVVSPHIQFSVVEYKKQADAVIQELQIKNKLPILCGGTGFYIQSVIDNILLPEVSPNKALRNELSTKPIKELLDLLHQLDPIRAQTIDQKNPRRLIRSIEIAQALGSVPKVEKNERFNTLQIGLHVPTDVLRKRIHTRILTRLDQGMIEEAHMLHKQGLSFERMYELGLEFKHLADFLKEKTTLNELREHLYQDIIRYARRQITWFKKDSRIEWFDFRNTDGIEKRVKDWILE